MELSLSEKDISLIKSNKYIRVVHLHDGMKSSYSFEEHLNGKQLSLK